MKGTFYSADFIKVTDSCTKLLEINTDTGVMNSASLELTTFNNLLLSESIDDVQIIYKNFQRNAVNLISSSLPNSIVTCSLHEEDRDSIYPTSITDTSNRFILRMAYDENALLDSYYCKVKLNVHDLMLENNVTGSDSSTPEIYYSSSNGVLYDTMWWDADLSNHYEDGISWLPDFVGKPIYESKSPIEFWTTGLSGSDASGYWNTNFDKGAIKTIYDDGVEDWFIEKFYYDTGSVTRAKSIRHYGIVYTDTDSNIRTIFCGGYKSEAAFDLPTKEEVMEFVTGSSPTLTVTEPTGSTTSVWKYPIKYFYQHATNTPKVDSFGTRAVGLLKDTEIRRSSGSYDYIQNLAVSESVDSYYVSGSNRDSSDEADLTLSFSGSAFPSGSYLTSSMVVSNPSYSLDYNVCIELQLEDGLSIYGVNKSVLLYETESNKTGYMDIRSAVSGSHFLPTEDGPVGIISSSIAILDSPTYSGYGDDTRHFVWSPDVEDVDTFIISSSQDINGVSFGVVAHNTVFKEQFCCFAAGTEISLTNGDTKNIEDIVVGDEVLGWNGNEIEGSVVTAIDHTPTVGSHIEACKSLGDEPSLYTINDTGVEFTPEHPILTKEGWKSLVPDWNHEPYKTEQEPKFLQVGDFILRNGEWEEIKEIRIARSDAEEKVYNITVQDISSYLANGIVVHNK